MDKVLLAVAAIFEAITGIVLIIAPRIIKLLLGTNISDATPPIARIVGFSLLVLGIACWPRGEAIIPRLRTMLVYNVLVIVYLGYLRFSSESVGILFLPAIAVHAVLAILFVGVWFKRLTT
jgi:hypothetical protein